ncbi:MAG: type II toxin-antitoxin system HicA family toxin [Bacteroidota bacterium]
MKQKGYKWENGMSPKEIIAQLKANNWELKRVKGSHHVFMKNGISLIVPLHKTISKGVFESIKKQVFIAESLTK